jgi:ribosome biogenesis GTPase
MTGPAGASTPTGGPGGAAGTQPDDLAQLTPDLASLGWDRELDAWAETIDVGDAEAIPGRLARVSRGYSLVFTGGDAVLAASGSARVDLAAAPATGDFVVVADDPDDGPVLAAVADRRSALRRRAPGRVPEPQVLAANIGAVLVMHGLDRQVNLRRLERQLVVAWDSGAEPIIVLTKADLLTEPSGAPGLEHVSRQVEAVAPGVEVLPVSTVTGLNLDRVRRRFAGYRSVALLGLSGVGKSSLVNTLSDGIVQRIGEVRATDRRGRHTTVTRDLIPLPSGGFVIDAPGVREIGLWQADAGLAMAFPEIGRAAAGCRFSDCHHRDEPGCAVRSAVANAAIPHRRLEHWQDLVAELAQQDEQLEDAARRAESRDRADAEERRDRARPSRRRQGRRRRPKG